MSSTVEAEKSFHIVDYLIFAFVLIVSLGIGLYHAFTGGRQRTTNEFFMGGRHLKAVPVALSILVSFISAITVLGTPAEMYTRGTQLSMRVLGYCCACVLSSLLLVPLFFHLKVTSSFEYLEMRFQSKSVRRLGSVTMLIGNLFYMGLLMYSPSSALEATTGFPIWASIIITGVVSSIYTTMGGMRAVVYTDVFQAFVMMGGMLLIVIVGSFQVGGITKVWDLSKDGGRLIFFDFSLDPTERLNFWAVTIGGTVSTLGMFGIGQTTIQRYCAVASLAEAKRSIYLNIPGLLLVTILASLTGLVVYAYYAALGCDPLRNGDISSSNQLVSYFVIDVLNYPGFPGIFLAVLFSGALSSMSSVLNSVAAVTWEDGLKLFFHKITEERKAIITKVLVCIYGVLGMMVAFGAQHLGGHVLQASLSFTGATMSPTLGMFLLGAFFPWANAAGAISGCLVATSVTLWLTIGSYVYSPHKFTQLPMSTANCSNDLLSSDLLNWTNQTTAAMTTAATSYEDAFTTSFPAAVEPALTGMNRFYGISFQWYSVIGVTITLIVGIIVSLLTRSKGSPRPDEKYLIPVLDRLCGCLPWKLRQRCKETCTTEEESLNAQDPTIKVEAGVKDSLVPSDHSNGSEKKSDLSQGDREKTHLQINGKSDNHMEVSSL